MTPRCQSCHAREAVCSLNTIPHHSKVFGKMYPREFRSAWTWRERGPTGAGKPDHVAHVPRTWWLLCGFIRRPIGKHSRPTAPVRSGRPSPCEGDRSRGQHDAGTEAQIAGLMAVAPTLSTQEMPEALTSVPSSNGLFLHHLPVKDAPSEKCRCLRVRSDCTDWTDWTASGKRVPIWFNGGVLQKEETVSREMRARARDIGDRYPSRVPDRC